MDRTKAYQQIVEQLLTQYLEFQCANADIHNDPIINQEARQYIVMIQKRD